MELENFLNYNKKLKKNFEKKLFEQPSIYSVSRNYTTPQKIFF